MATENRLIDANAIENGIAVYVATNAYLNDTALDAPRKVAEWIDESPTVDAVEVVRCKDCKHYMLWEDSEDKRTCSKSIGLMISDPDDFCSYGERKDDGQ